MWNYLTQENPGFRTTSWAMGLFVLWLFIIIAAVIWLRSLPPKNPARLAYRKRTATGLLIIAGIGVAQLILRMFGVPGIEWRIWGYVLFVALLVYATFAYLDRRNRLPARVTSTGKAQRVERAISSRKPSASGSASANATITPSEPRPAPITARREARRAKKRRK